MTVTFALCGMGEAFLDDVTVQAIDRPATATTPQGTAAPGAAPQAGMQPGNAAPQWNGPQASGPRGTRPR